MPLYPHSILKKPKDLKVDIGKSDASVGKSVDDNDNDVFDRPAAQPGTLHFFV
jgi:hypothetical protein